MAIARSRITCKRCKKDSLYGISDIHMRIYNKPTKLVTKYSVICPKCGLRIYVTKTFVKYVDKLRFM